MPNELYDVTAEAINATLAASGGSIVGVFPRKIIAPGAGYPLLDNTGKVVCLAQISYPMNGSSQKSTASGPAPDQVQRVFSSPYLNPSGSTITSGTPDTPLGIVGGGQAGSVNGLQSAIAPNGPSATLAAAINATGAQIVTLSNTNNIVVGMTLYIDTVASGQQEKVTVLAVNTGGTNITALFTKTHASGAVVFGTTSFLLTDFVVTGYGASMGNPAVILKYNTPLIGAITAGAARQFQLTHLPANQQYGGGLFVGATFTIDYGNAQAESVVVTTYNPVTGIGTATFANSHSAGAPIGVVLDCTAINSTKGIEEVGIESQPVAPPGTSLVINIASFTGTAYVNVRGVEQF